MSDLPALNTWFYLVSEHLMFAPVRADIPDKSAPCITSMAGLGRQVFVVDLQGYNGYSAT